MLLLIKNEDLKEILVIISTNWTQATTLIGTEKTKLQKIYQGKFFKKQNRKT
jgi:hypothetical protein